MHLTTNGQSLWFVVGVAIAANALQLMRSSNAFEISKAALWIVAIVAAVWMTIPLFVALFSGKATLGIGCLLGLCCAATALLCLSVTDAEVVNPRIEQGGGGEAHGI